MIRRFGMLLAVLWIGLVPMPALSAGAAFDILEFEVRGNTLLPQTAIEAAVYPHMGEAKSIDDVEAARAALEKTYRDQGFSTVSVSIPEQSVADAVIELEVLEGRVGQVTVAGARYFSQGRILETLASVAPGGVPNFKTLRDELAQVNRNADLRVQPLLRPGHEPGTMDVELKVQDELPVHGSVELSNKYGPSRAPDPGDTRLAVSLSYANLWQRGHSVALSYLTSPSDRNEVEVWSAAYTLPTGAAGDPLAMYMVHSDSTSDLATTLAGTNVLGKGDIVGLRWVHALRGGEALAHSLTLGLDYKHLTEDLVQAGGPSYPTQLTYWVGSANYSGNRRDAGGATEFGAGVALSVRGLRDNESEFAQKRYRGQGNFAILRWNAGRTQLLPEDFAVTGRMDGQFASLALPSSEQFAAGGADSVRGYPEAVQVGDQGARAMLQLQSPRLFPDTLTGRVDLRLLAFVEGARLRILNPLPGQIDRYTLASRGVGLHLSGPDGLAAAMDYAWRIKDGLATDTHGSVERGGGRLHFNLSLAF